MEDADHSMGMVSSYGCGSKKYFEVRLAFYARMEVLARQSVTSAMHRPSKDLTPCVSEVGVTI